MMKLTLNHMMNALGHRMFPRVAEDDWCGDYKPRIITIRRNSGNLANVDYYEHVFGEGSA